MSATTVAAVLSVAFAGLAGCRRTVPQPMVAEREGAVPLETGAATLLPARCRKAEASFVLDDGSGRENLEIGDALAFPSGVAVGLVRHTSVGRTASVVILRRDPLAIERIVDLGATLGDAPPPHLGWRPPFLVAAAYVRRPTQPAPGGRPLATSDDTTREVALYAIGADSVLAPPFVVPQRRDDSLALDLAFAGQTGLLVWDEATSAPRGVVKGAIVTKAGGATARDLSPPVSDAELPRVIVDGSAFRVFWIARRPETPVEDASVVEATGEARTYGWIETLSVDSSGEPTSPVRRLTSADGHVSAYDVAVASAGEERRLVVAARDDGEALDGSGGSLLRIRLKGDVVETPVAYAAEGLGRGAPTFVSSLARPGVPSSFAVTWVGNDEGARWLPLDATGAPTSQPSAEEGFNDARPLLVLDGSTSEASTVLVASPSDEGAQIRVFACAK